MEVIQQNLMSQICGADLNIVGNASSIEFYLFQVDEVLIFNRTLTEPETILLNQISCPKGWLIYSSLFTQL